MKASTFENLIRKIVREEIDYSLRREIKTLKEDLRSEIKPTIVEHTEKQAEIPEATKQSLRDQIMGNEPLKQHSVKNFTSNGALNDLLNETAQGDTNTQTAMAPSILETPNMPAPVVKAVTRDYSELMKAINKKKGN
tara:strand:- start:1459 stop:1869 length:411 start_codon:yes stop_codon:yes gene_type:complete